MTARGVHFALTSDDDFEHTWSYFVELRDFHLRAAASGRPAVFSVDL